MKFEGREIADERRVLGWESRGMRWSCSGSSCADGKLAVEMYKG